MVKAVKVLEIEGSIAKVLFLRDYLQDSAGPGAAIEVPCLVTTTHHSNFTLSQKLSVRGGPFLTATLIYELNARDNGFALSPSGVRSLDDETREAMDQVPAGDGPTRRIGQIACNLLVKPSKIAFHRSWTRDSLDLFSLQDLSLDCWSPRAADC
jgi:hypothetical protein